MGKIILTRARRTCLSIAIVREGERAEGCNRTGSRTGRVGIVGLFPPVNCKGIHFSLNVLLFVGFVVVVVVVAFPPPLSNCVIGYVCLSLPFFLFFSLPFFLYLHSDFLALRLLVFFCSSFAHSCVCVCVCVFV